MPETGGAHRIPEHVRVAVLIQDSTRHERAVSSLVDPGLEVIPVVDIAHLLDAITRDDVDAIVTEAPDSGQPAASTFRSLLASRTKPVIVVAGSDVAGVEALEQGAADYVVEPFAPRELRARTLLRARRAAAAQWMRLGRLTIDRSARAVRVDGRIVVLARREFDLLVFMAERPAEVISRETLLERIWGVSPERGNTATVTEHVSRLRRKIARRGGEPSWITTVRGAGYRFDP